MNRFLTAAAAAICLHATASEVTYVWDAANPATSFGDDVAIELNGSSVVTMAFANGSDRTVRLTGDSVAFAAGAQLLVPFGTVELAGGLSAAGDLNVSFPEVPTREWSISSGSLYKGTPTVVFENCKLADWTVESAHANGNFKNTALPYYESFADGVLTVQMQKKDGANTKCVTLCLRQAGADVTAEILWAKYIPGDVAGIDFATDPEGVKDYAVPTAGWDFETQRYYGCDSIRLRRRGFDTAPRRVVVRGDLNAVGVVTVSPLTTLAVDGNGSFPASDHWNVKGTLEIRDRQALTLTGTLTGENGTLALVNTATAGKAVTADYVDVVPADWTTLAENATLADLSLETMSGKLAGASLSTTPATATVCHLTVARDGQSASCQLQYRGSGTSNVKGCGLEFRQTGANVEFRTAYARYLAGEAGQVDLTQGTDRAIATAVDVAAYCVAEFHCRLGGFAAPMKVTMASGIAFAHPGLAVTIRGTEQAPAELDFRDPSKFPADGTVDVFVGGILRLSTSANFGTGTGPITVHAGGRLLQGGSGANSCLNIFRDTQRTIVSDGGEIAFGIAPSSASSGNDAVDVGGSTYLNNYTMRGGSVYSGKAVRVGNMDARWQVEGTQAETFSQSISLLAMSNDRHTTMTFDVADVTGDAATDFTLGGDIRVFKNAAYQNVTVEKTGAGTMRIDGETDYARNATEVKAGVWMLGGTGTMNAQQSLVLNGGSLAAAEGTANTLNLLTVRQDARIILADNSTLAFADCSDEEWTASRIDIEGDLSKATLRFGSDKSGLTEAQQRLFRCNGARVSLRDDGSFGYDNGLILLFR